MKSLFSNPIILGVSFVIMLVSAVLIYSNVNPEKQLISLPSFTSTGVMRYIYPRNVSVNQPFTVEVVVDTDGTNVNAAGIYLRYDTRKMQLLDMDTKDSFCQFYPERKFDNSLGTISLACGSPHPGFKGQNSILYLKFLPTAIGTTNLRAEKSSQLLVSDGKGTNILQTHPTAEITILNDL